MLLFLYHTLSHTLKKPGPRPGVAHLKLYGRLAAATRRTTTSPDLRSPAFDRRPSHKHDLASCGPSPASARRSSRVKHFEPWQTLGKGPQQRSRARRARFGVPVGPPVPSFLRHKYLYPQYRTRFSTSGATASLPSGGIRRSACLMIYGTGPPGPRTTRGFLGAPILCTQLIQRWTRPSWLAGVFLVLLSRPTPCRPRGRRIWCPFAAGAWSRVDLSWSWCDSVARDAARLARGRRELVI
mmetsp:Transcript_17379/g.49607  ORF Transcript_17379/g.49607 Transcript_17379/m.49607 type:complete len:240 (-) Transcript_17379:251-970(-)